MEVLLRRVHLVQRRHHLADRRPQVRLEKVELLADGVGELRVVRKEVLVIHEERRALRLAHCIELLHILEHRLVLVGPCGARLDFLAHVAGVGGEEGLKVGLHHGHEGVIVVGARHGGACCPARAERRRLSEKAEEEARGRRQRWREGPRQKRPRRRGKTQR